MLQAHPLTKLSFSDELLRLESAYAHFLNPQRAHAAQALRYVADDIAEHTPDADHMTALQREMLMAGVSFCQRQLSAAK